MLHAAVGSVAGFAVVRALLGIGEGGNFPAAIKTTAEWFPRRERALATGIFNSGANIGAVFAPAIIPPLALAFGWRAAFVIVGAIGIVWLVVWFAIYRSPDAALPRRRPRRSRGRSRSARRRQRECPRARLGRAAQEAPDVGVPDRQVPDRPGLVVLSVLAAEVAQRVARHGHAAHRPAARLHLRDDDRRQHRRRLALVGADARAAGA